MGRHGNSLFEQMLLQSFFVAMRTVFKKYYLENMKKLISEKIS